MDSKAIELMVDEIGPRIYRYFKFKGATDSASDLTQETFLRLVEKYQRFDSARGPLIAFALGIAQNIWREKSRRTKLTVALDEDFEFVVDNDLQQELERADQAEKLRAIVRRLSQIQQDILYFYFDEEITTREISEMLSIPEGTIKSHLHRAKETIRTVFPKELL